MANIKVAEECRYNRDQRRRIASSGPALSFAIVISQMAMWGSAFSYTLLFAIFGVVIALFCVEARQRHKRSAAYGEVLRTKLASHYGRSLSQSAHVGIAPGRRMKSYDGDNAWDIGFLEVGSRLSYFGDQCSFSLSGSQILRTEVRRPFQSLFAPRLFLAFREPDSEELRWMIIEARSGRSQTESYVTLQRLRCQIALMPSTKPTEPVGLPVFA